MFTRAFIQERKCTYAWGGEQAYFWEGTRLEKPFVALGHFTLFA